MNEDQSSVLLYDETTKRRFLRLAHGQWAGKRFAVDLSVCESPLCGCANVSFVCSPQDTEIQRQDCLRFGLDVIEREVCRTDARKPTPEALALAEAVVAELQEDDWRWLYGHLVGAKQEAMEDADVTKLDAVFPPEIMAGDGSVVGYGEIFPFAHEFAFKIGVDQWLTEDQYCIKPDCECRDVVLQFLHLPDTPVGHKIQVTDEAPAVYYNYKRGTLKTAHAAVPGQPSLRQLVDAMKEANPDFDLEAEHRHLQLKTLYLKALLKAEHAAIPHEPTPPKVGRNDPCPCGSGKKYKKCCGR
jgi:hypothetical protein